MRSVSYCCDTNAAVRVGGGAYKGAETALVGYPNVDLARYACGVHANTHTPRTVSVFNL